MFWNGRSHPITQREEYQTIFRTISHLKFGFPVVLKLCVLLLWSTEHALPELPALCYVIVPAVFSALSASLLVRHGLILGEGVGASGAGQSFYLGSAYRKQDSFTRRSTSANSNSICQHNLTIVINTKSVTKVGVTQWVL